jgi:hypothetical protein
MCDWTFFNQEEKLPNVSNTLNLPEVISIMFKINIINANIQTDLSYSFKKNTISYIGELVSFLQQVFSTDETPSYELLLCKIDFIVILFWNFDFQDKNEEKELLLLELSQYFSAGDNRNISRMHTTGIFAKLCNTIKMTSPNDIEKYNLMFNIFENIIISEENSINLLYQNGVFRHIILICNDMMDFQTGKNLIAGFFKSVCKEDTTSSK